MITCMLANHYAIDIDLAASAPPKKKNLSGGALYKWYHSKRAIKRCEKKNEAVGPRWSWGRSPEIEGALSFSPPFATHSGVHTSAPISFLLPRSLRRPRQRLPRTQEDQLRDPDQRRGRLRDLLPEHAILHPPNRRQGEHRILTNPPQFSTQITHHHSS